nr:hypothetical protein [Tanacetum cinerariifolium]
MNSKVKVFEFEWNGGCSYRFYCGGAEDGSSCVVCGSVCRLLFGSSVGMLFIVCVSSDKLVFGSVLIGKGVFGSGSAVRPVFCSVWSILVSLMMVVGEDFGVRGIGIEDVLLV